VTRSRSSAGGRVWTQHKRRRAMWPSPMDTSWTQVLPPVREDS